MKFDTFKVQFSESNEDVLGSLAHDVDALLNRWQAATDRGYGLCESWGDITQGALNGFDALCQWLPRSFVTKAVGYTVMAALMCAWLAWQVADIACLWWQSVHATSYCFTLLQGGAVAAVCAGAALCLVVGAIVGVGCLAWRWIKPRVRVALGWCGPVGQVFVAWLFS